MVLAPNSVLFSFTSSKPSFKIKIKGEEVYDNNLQIKLNVKIFFKSKTEYTIVISDIYVSYALKEKSKLIPKRLEISELYNDKNFDTKEDSNRLFILELLDNAVKNSANSLNQAVKESVVFLN